VAEGIEVRTGKKGRNSYRASVWSSKDGRSIRKTFPTMAAAKSWRRDAEAELSRGRLRPPSPLTIEEAADELLDGMRTGVIRTGKSGHSYKPATIRSYERALQLRILPALGEVKISELRRADVKALVKKLQGEGLSGSTIKNTLDPLRVILREARDSEIISTDPMAGLRLPSDEVKRDRIATPEEAAVLIEAIPAEDRALWATAFFAGLRRGELRALRVRDLDLAKSEIAVERTWDDKEGDVAPKSDAGRRRVPMFGLLRGYLTDLLLDSRRGGEDLVFGRTAEDPFVPSTVRNRALAAWETAGMEPIGLHECRHSFASMLIDAGGNPKALQEALGHASIQMTWDRYGHLMPGGREELRERLDAYLGERVGAGSCG
jgi:integrase